ncbi:hypothetical protein EYF80_027706 [Liparis tanakae]|uniref:Uncharacterized protein n=1 Tax=Liparis tanakae TaxID=230148 RepID=A0A4Z2HB55_9TELE|nr:hypothetical protein EYF80_027706 [Liparis tanakae]
MRVLKPLSDEEVEEGKGETLQLTVGRFEVLRQCHNNNNNNNNNLATKTSGGRLPHDEVTSPRSRAAAMIHLCQEKTGMKKKKKTKAR